MKRIIPMVVAALVIGAVATAQFIIDDPSEIPAGTLQGAASSYTNVEKCIGARMVVYWLGSTDSADSLASIQVEVSDDNTKWTNAPATLLVNSLNATGKVFNGRVGQVCVTPDPTKWTRIPFRFMKLKCTASGVSPTNDIAGFYVRSTVFYDESNDRASDYTW